MKGFSPIRLAACCLAFLCLFCQWAPRCPAEGQADGPARAEDVSKRCRFTAGSNRKEFSRCLDRNYKTFWSSGSGSKAWVEVTLPQGKTAGAVWLQWYEHTRAWALLLPDEAGGWAEYSHTDGAFYSETLLLPPGVTRFRIAGAEGTSARFRLAELRVFSAGSLPENVQFWQPPAEKADLLLLAAHPDDEVLWFGGALPLYAGQRGLACQVCMMVPTMPYRRLELLDCLWTCGVRNYPVWGNYRDTFSGTLKKQYTHWRRSRVYGDVTGWLRRFKPDVVRTHDLNGEYGHGGHRVCADAVTHCLALAANPAKYPESARQYGVWDVPKCYLHLYRENVLDMDWQQPLSFFGGQTGFEVAVAAFRCHTSQQHTDYHVEDDGPCDCSLFGLYRSLVGPDVEHNDLFENLRPLVQDED